MRGRRGIHAWLRTISTAVEGVRMTKQIRCRDIGMNCDFEAQGSSDDEVVQKAAAHARAAHRMNDLSPELAAKVRAAIRTV